MEFGEAGLSKPGEKLRRCPLPNSQLTLKLVGLYPREKLNNPIHTGGWDCACTDFVRS